MKGEETADDGDKENAAPHTAEHRDDPHQEGDHE
jgi:hypothetical protein